MGHISLPVPAPSADKAPPAPVSQRQSMTALGGPEVDPLGKRSRDAPVDASAIDLINSLRAGRGLPLLTVSPQLGEAAQRHVADLARMSALSHIGPDGSSPIDRVRSAGYRPRMAAENVAGGHATAAEAVRSWQVSERHLANLLLPDAKHVGVARLEDPRSRLGVYWALVVAAPL